MKIIFIYLIVFCVLIPGCSRDEDKIDEPAHKDIKGTIVGLISCNKIVYEVEIDNSNNVDVESIGIINLPGEFQEIGLKIKFDIGEYKDEELACVHLRPKEIFTIIKVAINNNNGS